MERDYFPENIDEFQYLTSDGHIQMEWLMDNFRDFIARAGFRQSYKSLKHPKNSSDPENSSDMLLFAYLDQFVTSINGAMYMEIPTGRGRMDLLILHNEKKYIVENKDLEKRTALQGIHPESIASLSVLMEISLYQRVEKNMIPRMTILY